MIQATHLHVHQDDVKERNLVTICTRALFSIDSEKHFMARFLKPLLDDFAVNWVVLGNQDT
jgi:hypothetical protein